MYCSSVNEVKKNMKINPERRIPVFHDISVVYGWGLCSTICVLRKKLSIFEEFR